MIACASKTSTLVGPVLAAWLWLCHYHSYKHLTSTLLSHEAIVNYSKLWLLVIDSTNNVKCQLAIIDSLRILIVMLVNVSHWPSMLVIKAIMVIMTITVAILVIRPSTDQKLAMNHWPFDETHRRSTGATVPVPPRRVKIDTVENTMQAEWKLRRNIVVLYGNLMVI